jgi:hypothetical protein
MQLSLVVAAVAALSISVARPSSGQRPEPGVFGVFDADTMYSVLSPDATPAIRDPRHVDAERARAAKNDDEPVIGVVIGDDAVCWSTWHLDRYEIVNDHDG